MTITTNDLRDSYVATGGQTEFNYTFKIFNDTELSVYVAAAGVTPDSDTHLVTSYTVAGVGNAAGGTITFDSGLTLNDQVIIVSNVPFSRTVNYQSNGDFLPSAVNDDFDTNLTLIKQVKDDTNRSLKLSKISTTTGLTIPEPSASSAMRWKSDLSGLENFEPGTMFSSIPDDSVIADSFASLRSASFSQLYCYFPAKTALGDTLGGWFYKDASDTVSADNDSSVIVDAAGARWKRIQITDAVDFDSLALASTRVVDQDAATGVMGIPSGTTAERSTGVLGQSFRFNSTENQFEFHDGSTWHEATNHRFSILSTGTATAFSVATNRPAANLYNGMKVTFQAHLSNTGATTLGVDGIPVLPLRKYNNAELGDGDIIGGMWVSAMYTTVYNAWVMLNPGRGSERTLSYASASSGYKESHNSEFTQYINIAVNATIGSFTSLGPISWPISFPNACRSVTATFEHAGGVSYATNVQVVGKSTLGLNDVRLSDAGSGGNRTGTVNIIATGY